MASPHVPVARALRVPRTFAHVPGYLALHDADLRLRKSVDRPGFFVLERRCRRRSPIKTAMRDTSDIHVQGRDGYIHVSTVHPQWLMRPWNILRALKEDGEDLFAKGAMQFADELEYEDRWRRETAKRRRKHEFKALAREMYDLIDRHGGQGGTDRGRISNPGLPDQLKKRRRGHGRPRVTQH